MAENLDTKGPRNIDLLDAEVTGLVTDYAKYIYEVACLRHEAIKSPLLLSPIEMHRITRAFYRLKLFGVLSYDYTHRFDIDIDIDLDLELEYSYYEFPDRLGIFEIDKLATAYSFLFDKRLCIRPAYAHDDCPSLRIDRWRNVGTWKCEHCRRLCAIVDGRRGFATRHNAWELWSIMISKPYISLRGLWAMPGFCLQTPLKP
jgi:hypothetical protein